MTWTTEITEQSKASPEMIWSLWSDVANWPTWDNDIKHSELNGPFQVGGRGVIKPQSGPQTKFILTEVTVNQSFSNQSSLPGTKIEFSHWLTVGTEETAITHRVTMTGPLSFLFSRLIGAKIAKELPATVRSLARAAEVKSF